MLLNLSNHPLNTWSNKQVETAEKQYGKIIDIPFPKINPNADENEINDLNEKFLSKIINLLKKSSDTKNAVHIMGELNFTFGIVTKLLHSGITCIASTTNRDTINTENGKIVNFNFVRFREYKTPLIR